MLRQEIVAGHPFSLRSGRPILKEVHWYGFEMGGKDTKNRSATRLIFDLLINVFFTLAFKRADND